MDIICTIEINYIKILYIHKTKSRLYNSRPNLTMSNHSSFNTNTRDILFFKACESINKFYITVRKYATHPLIFLGELLSFAVFYKKIISHNYFFINPLPALRNPKIFLSSSPKLSISSLWITSPVS